jgi:hypothetical protein
MKAGQPMSKWPIGSRVQSVRRPGFYGTVIGEEDNFYVNHAHNRIKVKWDKVSKDSRGRWKSGVLDELPVDLRDSRSKDLLPDAEKKMTPAEYSRLLSNVKYKEL